MVTLSASQLSRETSSSTISRVGSSCLERRQRFEHNGLPPVEMRLLLQPEHAGLADRHFTGTAAALRYYGEWYGPYPYGHITIVDPVAGFSYVLNPATRTARRK